MGNILIVLEHAEGKLKPSALSAISMGQQANLFYQGKLLALLLGDDVRSAAAQAQAYGVDEVILAEHGKLRNYLAETYAPIIVDVARKEGATCIAGVSTSFGKDLFPRVAGLMSSAFASDVSAILATNQFRRCTHAGNVIQTVLLHTEMVVFTGRQTEFKAAPKQESLSKQNIFLVNDVPFDRSEFVEIRTQKRERPDLTEAKIVVSGGRGLKEKQNFTYLEEICDLVGGAMGASRAACDAGLVSNDLQIGQTGKVVAPDLYIAIAISGAIQHLAGMKGSKVIVAINKDPEAPIFQVADYGLVSTWEKALPEFIAELKKLKS